MKIELAKTEIIHFVGIGGIGMSGLALIMKRMGLDVLLACPVELDSTNFSVASLPATLFACRSETAVSDDTAFTAA